MSLISFLNDLFKEDGFELVDSNSKKYVIGNPKKEKPIVIKLLDQKLMQKLLIYPDLYFGEAYMDGSLVIQNGTLTEFLDLAFKNIGRGDINFYGSVIKKIKGTFRYLTNFNKIVKPDGINLDPEINPEWAKEKLKNVVIQGGLNPKILLKPDEDIFKAATKYIQTFKDIPYVFNLGHGLLPKTDPDKVQKLIKFYRNFNG